MARLWQANGWLALCAAGLLAALPAATAVVTSVPALAAAKAKPAEKSDADGKDDAKKAAAKKKVDPAAAQAAVDAAHKLLQAGKVDAAVVQLTGTLAAGRLPPPVMAKALVYRGEGYRKQGKPAQAISDLTSALWLKGGLTPQERTEALESRNAAYREAGLSDQSKVASSGAAPGPTEVAPSGGWLGTTSTANTRPARSPAPSSSLAEEGAPPTATSTVNIGSFFSGLFGGGGAQQAESAPAAKPAPAPSGPATSAWVSNTDVKPAPSTRTAAHSAPVTTAGLPEHAAARHEKHAAPAHAAPAKGHLRIQVASVRTPGEAQALAQKVKGLGGAELAQRTASVDQATYGNMGTFYRVLVGPFASEQDAKPACARLKGAGLDCLVLAQ